MNINIAEFIDVNKSINPIHKSYFSLLHFTFLTNRALVSVSLW